MPAQLESQPMEPRFQLISKQSKRKGEKMEFESTTPETRDFMKVNPPDTGKQRRQEKPNSDEDEFDRHDVKTDLKLTNEAPPGVYLFKTYMATKAPNKNITGGPGSSRQPLLPLQFGYNGPRPASRLEREIFPQLRNTEFSDCNTAPSQLTIFYDGMVNVYNNVPVDKAQAIMLLAGQSSLTKPMVAKSGEAIKMMPPHPQQISLPPICKPQDVPMARKHSLCLFLQKRHDRIRRITKKSPYCSSGRRNREMEPTEEEGLRNTGNGHHSTPLSPFPSRSGFFCSVSTTKR